MPTRQKILKMFLEGKTQEEILETLGKSDYKEDKSELKKLQTQIRESAFLSPKNLKYGSVLVFYVAYLSPVFAIYMRGYEFEVLLKPIFTLSLILSIPFLIFAIHLYFTKDLRRLNVTAIAFLVYYVIYMITFASVAADVHVWTIILFPLVIMPTMFIEWWKLENMIREIRKLKM